MKNATLETMKYLKLGGMASTYEAILDLPVNQHPDNHELIAQLIDSEQLYRSNKRMDLFMRLSRLRYHANLKDLDYSSSRNLKKEHITKLADGAYRSK